MSKDDIKPGKIVELDDGTKMWQVDDNQPKRKQPTKAQLELATKIVNQKATIDKWPNGYDVDMIAAIGVRHEANRQTRDEAIAGAAAKVADMLANGELVLGDDWEKQNLG